MSALAHPDCTGESGGESSLAAFLSWCRERGVEHDGVRVEARPARGRCLFARSACAAGDVLLRVPAAAIVAAGPRGDHSASHWMLSLVFRLLEEDASGPESTFAPFVQMLFETMVQRSLRPGQHCQGPLDAWRASGRRPAKELSKSSAGDPRGAQSARRKPSTWSTPARCWPPS
ncbi:unnamed protein product [Prorocentrum cordatum]|uniref:Uncharacterized protein n=1 Tax=Prorocentrum cordatum TaxID=2364126 RepID=A0ABN9W240_9DINO|nr:unnamed protein product [Polarella glacialis]